MLNDSFQKRRRLKLDAEEFETKIGTIGNVLELSLKIYQTGEKCFKLFLQTYFRQNVFRNNKRLYDFY